MQSLLYTKIFNTHRQHTWACIYKLSFIHSKESKIKNAGKLTELFDTFNILYQCAVPQHFTVVAPFSVGIFCAQCCNISDENDKKNSIFLHCDKVNLHVSHLIPVLCRKEHHLYHTFPTAHISHLTAFGSFRV